MALEETGSHFNEVVAAGVAILVSVMALAVSAYSTYWQRQSVRAQTWPNLQISYANRHEGKPGFWFSVDNVGVGPARVRAVQLSVHGKPVKTWTEAIIALMKTAHPEFHGLSIDAISSSLNERVIGAGAHVAALAVPGDNLVATTLHDHFDEISMEICYCSVLDECWLAEKDTPVASCKGQPNTFKQ